MALVSLSQIEKIYRRGREQIHVLSNLNLDVKEGEFVALMGPSGSGKSTVLNLIGGLDHPTGGRIEVNGKDITNFSNAQLAKYRSESIGFVFQFYNLLPFLTATRNVELPLLLTGLNSKERKERADTALQTVMLDEWKNHRPGELSGGQQQRVAIARAIVSDPQILVCDEPTGDLDRTTAQEILDLLETLHRRHNKTIIMVTHDPKAAEKAGHVFYLDKGQLTGEAA